MVKCPFCQHENEAGAVFCEKCKSDLPLLLDDGPATMSGGPLDPVIPELVEEAHAGAPPVEPLMPQTERLDQIPIVELGSPAEACVESLASSLTLESSAPAAETKPVSAEEPELETPPPTERLRQDLTAPKSAPAETTQPKLLVVRGERPDVQYKLYPGKNYIGRSDEKPVDVDLDDQEPEDKVWSSRQHAVITYENGALTIEDLQSLNGTFVNRVRVHPGQVRPLQSGDLIQIGTVHLRVMMG